MLAGKAVVVTGGSRGIGLAVAEACVAEGASVLLVAREARALAGAARLLQARAAAGRVAVLAADVTASDASVRILAAVLQAFERWDTLVNSAGTFAYKPFELLTDADWQQTLDVNLTAPYRLTRAMAAHLRQCPTPTGGAVVNIGSVHAAIGDPLAVAQCAAKRGLVGLTVAAAEACRAENLRVNCISPGAIEPLSASRESQSVQGQGQVTQADVAQLAVYLASDRARFITGATIDAFGATRPVLAPMS